MKRIALKTIPIYLISFIGILLLGSAVSAADRPIDFNFVMQMEYMYHQGMIQSVSPSKDTFTVSGKKVYLVDVSQGQEHYKTSIKEIDGSQASANNLTVGTLVFVWGGVMRGGCIAAKDILILNRTLSDKEIEKLPMILKHEIWGGKRILYD